MKLNMIIPIIALLTSPYVHSEAGVSDTAIKIGIIGPLSGPSEALGKAIFSATKASINQLNKSGGIAGRKIELIHCDDKYEPKNTVECYNKLVKQDGVFAFLNIFGAPSVSAIVSLVDTLDIPTIGSISAANHTDPLHKNIFMIRPNSALEFGKIVDHIVQDRNVKTVGVLYQNDAFGTSGLNAIHSALKAKNLNVHVSGTFNRNTTEVDAAVDSITKKSPEAVGIVGVYPGTAAFVKRAYDKKFNPIYFGPVATTTPEFLKDISPLNLKFYAVLAMPPLSDTSFGIIKSYLEAMKASEFTDLNPFGAEAFFNTEVFFEALRIAGKDITRPKLINAFENMKDKDFGGIKVTFSPQDHLGRKIPYLAALKDGKLVTVQNFK